MTKDGKEEFLAFLAQMELMAKTLEALSSPENVEARELLEKIHKSIYNLKEKTNDNAT